MPATDDFPTGAAIGEPVPEFTLPDQHGRPIALSEVLKESRALLVFHRSARW
jgi:peroxiredoxin